MGLPSTAPAGSTTPVRFGSAAAWWHGLGSEAAWWPSTPGIITPPHARGEQGVGSGKWLVCSRKGGCFSDLTVFCACYHFRCGTVGRELWVWQA